MIVALSVDRDKDLSLFSGFLAQNGVRHRISEDGDQQVLRVYDEADVTRVQTLYARLESGEIQFERHEIPPEARPPRPFPSLLEQVRRAPFTLAMVLISVAAFPATFGIDKGHFSSLLHLMTFVPFEQGGGYLYFAHLHAVMVSGQYWRLITPIFLHFGIMHIAFDMTFLWVFGSRIEAVSNSLVLFSIVLATALISNLTQYAVTGPTLFGGMSGVDYGLVGYGLVWSIMVPRRHLGMPVGVYIALVALMLIGTLGVFNFMMPGKLANGAHVGGLVSGLFLGFLYGWFARRRV